MDSDEKVDSISEKTQYDISREFIRSLNLCEGDKVLDFGCGTGDVTKFIADMVGSDGEVVGIDPDEERIKIAQEKFKDVQTLKFIVSDGTSKFPHDDEEYYDLHFSSDVFLRLKGGNKKLYLEKAYECLKPGGRLAIQTDTVLKEDNKLDAKIVKHLAQKEFGAVSKDGPSNTSVTTTEMISNISYFDNFEELDAWMKATNYNSNTHEIDSECEEWLNVMREKCRVTRAECDGVLTLEVKELVRITGRTKKDL